jgi:hypothetical protein
LGKHVNVRFAVTVVVAGSSLMSEEESRLLVDGKFEDKRGIGLAQN